MIPDISLAAGIWHDFYSVTGIAPGTDTIACNRGNSIVLAYEGAQPPVDAWWGWPAQVGDGLRIKAPSAWIKSGAPIILAGAQEYTP